MLFHGIKTKFFFTLFALFLLGCSVPTLLSTPLGKRLLFNLIEKRYHLSLEADNLSLSWWGPQKIEHLKISPLCLEWEVIQTDLTLFQLIRSDAKKFYGKNGQIVLPTSGKSLQGIDASLQSSPEKTWDLHLTNVD